MAKRKTETEGKAGVGHNGISAEKAKPYLDRIENLFGQLASLRGTYMAEAKVFRQDIKEIYSEAKSNGIPARALKGLVRYRELERKQRELSAGLDIDESAAFEQLVDALGEFAETPLGQAAQSSLKEVIAKGDAIAREAEANLAKLGRGKDAASEAVDSLTH